MSNFCSPNASTCYQALAKDNHGCRVSCTGLYADLTYTNDAPMELSPQEKIRNNFKNLAELGIPHSSMTVLPVEE